MNSSHVAVGAGAGGTVALLAPILAQFFKLDPAIASDVAGLVVGAGGAAVAAVYSYFSSRSADGTASLVAKAVNLLAPKPEVPHA